MIENSKLLDPNQRLDTSQWTANDFAFVLASLASLKAEKLSPQPVRYDGHFLEEPPVEEKRELQRRINAKAMQFLRAAPPAMWADILSAAGSLYTADIDTSSVFSFISGHSGSFGPDRQLRGFLKDVPTDDLVTVVIRSMERNFSSDIAPLLSCMKDRGEALTVAQRQRMAFTDDTHAALRPGFAETVYSELMILSNHGNLEGQATNFCYSVLHGAFVSETISQLLDADVRGERASLRACLMQSPKMHSILNGIESYFHIPRTLSAAEMAAAGRDRGSK